MGSYTPLNRVNSEFRWRDSLDRYIPTFLSLMIEIGGLCGKLEKLPPGSSDRKLTPPGSYAPELPPTIYPP